MYYDPENGEIKAERPHSLTYVVYSNLPCFLEPDSA